MPVGFAVIALLALFVLWKIPQWQVRNVEGLAPKERFDRVNEARKTLATILGGAAFLVGGFFTWQNIKVAQGAASTSQRALEVSREGQITDRFSKAIEQLSSVDKDGKKRVEVRLGGIYALEGIAKESPELHWPIMEVLTAYVRLNAPNPQKSTQENPTATAPPAHPAADIQAILTVLGRRDQQYENVNQSLDLSETEIQGADLRKAQLDGANLNEADLDGANLDLAHLNGAHLIYARLGSAHLGYAGLAMANLYLADLSGANLSRANLQGADLEQADFSGADLSGANLTGAELRWAGLYKAILVDTDLRDTKSLTQKQIDAAMGDGETKLPTELHRPDSWKEKK